MTVFRTWLPEQPLPPARRAVALGVFDGLHIGHRAVISAACGVLDHGGDTPFLSACVLSLSGVPKTGDRLTDPAERPDLCKTLGVDEWIDLPFAAVRDLSPAAFVTEILHEKLHARAVCCGYNYRFGKGGAGDADTLRRLCEPLGIAVTVAPSAARDGQTISATAVRAALQNGDMRTAARLLGRPYAVMQPVTRGNRIGRTLGFPTVNQVFPEGAAVPRFGVYASLTVIGQRQYAAVTNVGVHPTVGGCARPQAETWIADFDGDLYDRTLRVELIDFLRPEQQFSSIEELKAQIEQDKQAALARLAGEDTADSRAVLFDFDDTLQDRFAAFYGVATEMLTRHFPTLDPDEIARRAEYMLAENNGGYVNYDTYFENLLARWEWQGVTDAAQLRQEYHRCFPRHTALFDDTADTLRELRRRGYRLGIITNGSRLLQNRKLDLAKLRPLLDVVVVSDDEGVRKPHAEIFRRAAARLCVSPRQCVFVGDHPVNDIAGAMAAGMRPVYINAAARPDAAVDAPRIHTPAEILDLLK